MPHRQEVLKTLDLYRRSLGPYWQKHLNSEELSTLAIFQDFIESTPDCFERTQAAGHLTGSALIVSPDLKRVLLTHHKKLDKWLQLGGHADGDPRIHATALREGEEESGLAELSFLDWVSAILPDWDQRSVPMPFDLDSHLIPKRKEEAAHIHYDVRFLLCAGSSEEFTVSDESNDLKWFTLSEARSVTNETSMLRQFQKLEHITKILP